MSSFINFLYNLVGGSNLSDIIKTKPITLKKNYLNPDGKFNLELIDDYMEDILSQISDKIRLEDGSLPNNLSLLIGENNIMLDKDGNTITSKVEYAKIFDLTIEFENLENIDPNNFDFICIGPNFEILKKYFSGCFEKIIFNLCKTHLIKDINLYIANCTELLKYGGKLFIDANNYASYPCFLADINCQYENIPLSILVSKLKKNTHDKFILNIGKSDKIYSAGKYSYPSKLLEIQQKAIEYNSESVLTVEILDNSKIKYLDYVDSKYFSLDNFKYFACLKGKKIEPIKFLADGKVLINDEYLIDLNKHKLAPTEPPLDDYNRFRFVHKKEKAF